MVVAEHTLSEFLQHPTKVTKELARGPVALHRRGAEDLVLMTREQNGTLETSARLFATVATQGEAHAATVLPWLAYLSARDRKECLRELAVATSTAMATGRLDLLRDTLYAWEATGLAAWDMRNRRGDSAYRDEAPVPVRRPS